MSFLSRIGKAVKQGYKDITGGGKTGIFNVLTGGGYGLAGSMFKKGPGTPLDKWVKPLSPGGKREAKEELEGKARANEAAALAKAHEDEVSALGARAQEALRNKRRRGLYATILTGSGPSAGSPGSSSGKSTLGS
jgi:hypothetical protein